MSCLLREQTTTVCAFALHVLLLIVRTESVRGKHDGSKTAFFFISSRCLSDTVMGDVTVRNIRYFR